MMKTFKQFLIQEAHTHSTHLEDLILDAGASGARAAIDALKGFRDAWAGKGSKAPAVTLKVDGSPALIWGIDPTTKKFFVGTKGVFAKNPKMNFTHNDVDANHSGDLAAKLHVALDCLPKITPKNRIFQGDFMFTKGDIFKKDINGETNLCWHPNTIVYTTPINSGIGKTVAAAKMGIVVHTEYTGGPAVQDMTAKFGVSASGFGKSKDVWIIDANYESAEGIGNLTAAETAEFDKIINSAESLFKSVSTNTFKLLTTDKDLNMLVNTFNNSIIRSGKAADPETQATELIQWIKNRFQKDIDAKKTDKAKATATEKLKLIVDKINIKELTNIFRLQSVVAAGKRLVLGKLNEISSLGTFIRTKDGFSVTNHEGFVGVSGDIAGVKLVDRLEFSHYNFSKNIIRGWDK